VDGRGGVAIASGDAHSQLGGGVIGNFTLQTPNAINGNIVAGAIGLYSGGDPSGQSEPATNFGNKITFHKIKVIGFDVAVKFGNNSYSVTFFEPDIEGNNIGFTSDPEAFNSGEQNQVFGGTITGNGTAAIYNSPKVGLQLFGTPIDFNGESAGNAQIVNTNVRLHNCHMETHRHTEYFSNSGTYLTMRDGSFSVDGANISVSDASMTAGSRTLTSAKAKFAPAEVGSDSVTVAGAGPGGAALTSLIVGYTNARTVTLADAASTTVANASLTSFMPQLVTMSGGGLLQLDDVTVYSNTTVQHLVTWNKGTPGASLRLIGLHGYGVRSYIAALPGFTNDVEINSSLVAGGNVITLQGTAPLLKFNQQVVLSTGLRGGGVLLSGNNGSLELTPDGGTHVCSLGTGGLNCGFGAGAFSSLQIGGGIVLPSSLTGYHGNAAGTKVQLSDGSGSGHLAALDASGNLTDGGTGAAGHATCWKSSGTIGYCSTQPDAKGACTCN